MDRLYDYQCLQCNHTQEAWRHINDRKKAPPCDKCGGAMRHVVSKLQARRPTLDTTFPGEKIRNNRSAIEEYEKFQRVHSEAEKESKLGDV